ncbi:MAG TPA: serine hydrolase, partial [Pirellulaceae bacterium]|nr:serine hydrolase [Pirellulaceae bacterium]
HTSGLRSYTDKPEFMSKVTKPIEPPKLIEWFKSDPPDFKPGRGFHYNNSAYFLLGEIVAQLAGKPFAEHLRETIFEPFEMHDTGVFVNAKPPEAMALGYSWADGKYSKAIDWDMSWAGGAGALYSTVGDLYRWNEALYGGKVLEAEMFKRATTPNPLPDDADGMNYGYGLVISEIRRLPTIAHGGGLNGWSTYLVRLPEQKVTVVALSNAQPGPPKFSPVGIARDLAERLLADEIAKRPGPTVDTAVDPKTFAAYVGRYDYKAGVMRVTVDGDQLFGQLTGQSKLRFYPKGRDAFFLKEADADLEFRRAADGQVTGVRHSQNGNLFTAPRLNKLADDLTADQVEKFVGKYLYGLTTVMTVTRDENQLFAQLTGQPRFPIFPIAENEFEWHVVQAKVRFVKTESGTVLYGEHTQNGATSKVLKIK